MAGQLEQALFLSRCFPGMKGLRFFLLASQRALVCTVGLQWTWAPRAGHGAQALGVQAVMAIESLRQGVHSSLDARTSAHKQVIGFLQELVDALFAGEATPSG
jgi:hypothetical protein